MITFFDKMFHTYSTVIPHSLLFPLSWRHRHLKQQYVDQFLHNHASAVQDYCFAQNFLQKLKLQIDKMVDCIHLT